MLASLVRSAYQLSIALYPAEFRREHRDGMLLLFDELVADRGILIAATRTSIDLVATVPRYRLEAVMTESSASRVLASAIAGLLALGFTSVMFGIPWLAPVLILPALALALANRRRLVRSVRTPDSSRRARRFRLSAISTAIFAACVVGYIAGTWDGQASTVGLLLPTILGPAALCAAVCFLVSGLLTPRSPGYPGAS